ncbi:aminoacyl-histidine dipeptidase [Dechloromonas sp. ZY10]|uniref:aminoacyl-histidine dipeptidase n=1 Tax=Dechloromonas aquae TaxID=2664436 RepID=UPI003526F845
MQFVAPLTPFASEQVAAPFDQLAPLPVWRHFSRLCAIPRPSKHEDELRRQILDWAVLRGLGASIDAAGNLILRKPATPGCERQPGVVLQAHLDMVCQKNAEVAHDFHVDPIQVRLADGWLTAPGTTLGADNGIGVALILAVLEDRSLRHGPLEALLTVDEEAGMGGARGLQPGQLQGRLLLNLDTEDWGQFYLGCAGGLDVEVERSGSAEAPVAGMATWAIEVSGLRGGHSGVDIHEGRGNAVKLLVRVLKALEHDVAFRLSTLRGGNARNALPREAEARIAVPAEAVARLPERIAAIEGRLREELLGIDDGLRIYAHPAAPVVMPLLMAPVEQRLWLDALHAAPHGVRRMSRQLPGVVETSNNLGIVDLRPAGGRCNFMVRSLVDAAAHELADEIVSLFALAGTPAVKSGFYPGWKPNPDSPLLAVCQQVYRRGAGSDGEVKVIHAGLECGLIGDKYPGMDMVSFGPTIRGAHAPGERVEVASVERCWGLLLAILSELAGPAA